MLAFFANISMAQNKERVNAFNYNKNAQSYITTAEQLMVQNRADKAQKQMANAKIELTRAKTSIDLAAENEETKNDAKTWHYYGVIYLKIATYPEFNDIDTEALTKCADAFKNWLSWMKHTSKTIMEKSLHISNQSQQITSTKVR